MKKLVIINAITHILITFRLPVCLHLQYILVRAIRDLEFSLLERLCYIEYNLL